MLVALTALGLFLSPSLTSSPPPPPILAPAISAPLVQAKSSQHLDERLGFKFKPPKDWSAVPLKVDESWQVAKYLSPRGYIYNDPQGWTWEHKPQLVVIAFVTKVVEKEIEVEKKDENTTEIRILNPYKNYEDYLARTYSGGGYYTASDEAGEVDGVKVRKLEIKVEKLSYNGPKRVVTWIFQAPDIDFAVQVEVLENSYPKLKKELEAALKSFRVLPRAKGALDELDSKGMDLSPWAWSDLPVFDRRLRRQDQERVLHERATKNLPEGWTSKKFGRFLVLNRSDDRCAQRMVERGEALIGWLEERFPFVGPEEYVRAPILRICKDYEEQNAFQSGTGWGTWWLEIVTHDDKGGNSSWQGQYFNWRVFELWFQERDKDLFLAFPPWLRQGLRDTAEDCVVSKGKVEFRVDGWERDSLRERSRGGRLSKPRDLLLLSSSAFYDKQDWGMHYETEALARFLISPAAQRNPRTKDLLPTYLRNLKIVVEEIKAEEKGTKEKAGPESGPESGPDGEGAPKNDGETPKKPQTEEEEEAAFKAEQTRWKDREQRIVDQSFERTFGAWSEKDWADFEKAYFASLD
jgi:hypothetical protein